jgi:ADP-ribosylglycohydrolase
VRATGLVDGIEAAVRGGGDTDTVAAIAGALLGARFGGSAVPCAGTAGCTAGRGCEPATSPGSPSWPRGAAVPMPRVGRARRAPRTTAPASRVHALPIASRDRRFRARRPHPVECGRRDTRAALAAGWQLQKMVNPQPVCAIVSSVTGSAASPITPPGPSHDHRFGARNRALHGPRCPDVDHQRAAERTAVPGGAAACPTGGPTRCAVPRPHTPGIADSRPSRRRWCPRRGFGVVAGAGTPATTAEGVRGRRRSAPARPDHGFWSGSANVVTG